MTYQRAEADRRSVTSELTSALMAYADTHELPLTTTQVAGLARTAGRALLSADATVTERVVALPPQQLAALRALANGETLARTSRRLGISQNTIKSHRVAMYRRLGVTSSHRAVAVGIGLGLITLTPKKFRAGRAT
jgi:DNA-binding NarL/FixJ family response regulator